MVTPILAMQSTNDLGSVAPITGHPSPAAAKFAAVDAELRALLHNVRLAKAMRARGLASDASPASSASPRTPSRVEPVFFRDPFATKLGARPAPRVAYVAPHQPSPRASPAMWDTADGRVQQELIDLVRTGALDLAQVVPAHPSALSSAGWRQLGDLCMDLATAARDDAQAGDVRFARVAQTLLEASRLYAIAGVLDGTIVDCAPYPTLRIAEPHSPADSSEAPAHPQSRWSPDSSDCGLPETAQDDDFKSCLDMDSDAEPEIRAPVPLKDDAVGRRVVDWLEGVAERRVERLAQWARRPAVPGPIEFRRFEDEEDAAEAGYRLYHFGDRDWSPA